MGGGHAHAVVLRRLRTFISKELDVALVTPDEGHLYSGMIPGIVAGHYAQREAEIGLAGLARQAGGELVEGHAQRIDLAGKRLVLGDGRALGYDYLSLDIGALPNFGATPGAREHAIGAKPFRPMLERWQALRGSRPRIAVAGAGAAGVELAMAMKFAGAEEVTLFSDRASFPESVEARILDALARMDVALRSDCPVSAVEPGPTVVSPKGRERFDALFWTGGAAAPPLIAESGLKTDAAGYGLVNANLRSVSDPHVFAAGDCATLMDSPHPKSGVFAVRHGAVLAENLMRAVRGHPPVDYQPQRQSLVLLSCGERYAIAIRGGWSAEGAWAWRWKDWIDRRWIRSFR